MLLVYIKCILITHCDVSKTYIHSRSWEAYGDANASFTLFFTQKVLNALISYLLLTSKKQTDSSETLLLIASLSVIKYALYLYQFLSFYPGEHVMPLALVVMIFSEIAIMKPKPYNVPTSSSTLGSNSLSGLRLRSYSGNAG